MVKLQKKFKWRGYCSSCERKKGAEKKKAERGKAAAAAAVLCDEAFAKVDKAVWITERKQYIT